MTTKDREDETEGYTVGATLCYCDDLNWMELVEKNIHFLMGFAEGHGDRSLKVLLSTEYNKLVDLKKQRDLMASMPRPTPLDFTAKD